MSEEQDDNRRREQRVWLNAPVRISTIDPETDPGTGKRFFRSSSEICSNVSRSGLFIRTTEPLEPGRRLLLELKLPDGRDVDAVGRVAWVKKGLEPSTERGVGVELLGADPDQLGWLQALVTRGAPRRRNRSGPSSRG